MINLDTLNKNQLEAVTSPLGTSLVIAGAGTGKTRVLTTRLAYLIAVLGFKPWEILAITFTNRAANEMKQRVKTMTHQNDTSWICTYHSLCLQILREHIGVLNKSKNFNVIDDEDQLLVIKGFYKKHNILQKTISPKKILEIISKIKFFYEYLENDINDYLNIQQLVSLFRVYSLDEWEIIKKFYFDYLKHLAESNSLDFDDLLIYAYKVLHEHENIRLFWQNKFKYILIDEFQDTNKIQFDIISNIINQSNPNVFIVGDPDQTIYTWRGAYPNIFKDFLNKYEKTKIYVLDLNYRSTQNILSLANSLIRYNSNRIEKDLQANDKEQTDVFLYEANNQFEEGKFVVNQIKSLIKENKCLPKDIVILYRANYLTRFIESSLIDGSIQYYIYGGYKFYKRMEIKDMLAYLSLMVNEDDSISLKRIINSPKRDIGLTTIEKLNNFANTNNITFAQSLRIDADQLNINKNNINKFLSLLGEIKFLKKDLTISQTLDLIIEKTKYKDYLNTLTSDNEQFNERINNINELKNSITEYEKTHDSKDINKYLQEISLYTDGEIQKKTDDAISLMTFHTAKGTEYKCVFIIGFCDEIIPGNELYHSIDIEEERRVAYVGITRAKKYLYITYTNDNSFGYIKHSPSRFIHEFDKNTYKQITHEYQTISHAKLHWFDSKKNIDYQDNYENKTINFTIGDIVIHTLFGQGIVVGLIGDDLLEILFKAPYGRKTLVKNHKSLKRLKN